MALTSEQHGRDSETSVSQDVPGVGRGGVAWSEALRISLWFGLTVGLLELGLMLAIKPIRDPSPGFFRMNRHTLWTIPTVNLVLFLTLGAVLAVFSRLRIRASERIGLYVLSFAAFLTLLVTYPRLFLLANILLACGFAYRFVKRIERDPLRFGRVIKRSTPILAVAWIVVVGVAIGRDVWPLRQAVTNVPEAGQEQMDVLLVVLDTVRADRLSLYGYNRATTPNLERLAKRGIVFDHARSTSPWTLPSHSSMMTGRWPHQLNCDINNPLDATFPTLAQFLNEQGYATAGFVANINYAGAETGLARGFEVYRDHDISPLGALRSTALGKQVIWPILHPNALLTHKDTLVPRKNADVINQQFLNWLDERPGGRPFFAFLNFFDAHDPYLPPANHARSFSQAPRNREELRSLYQWFIRDKSKTTESERQFVNDAYDECLVYLDNKLGELFEELERRGVLDTTLVIVTSDHGEHFGAHGLYGHASSLYAQETRVPLLILPPRVGGTPSGLRVDDPVSLRDLAATIVESCLPNADQPSPFPGRTLAEHWQAATQRGQDATMPRNVLSSIDAPVTAAPNQGRSPVFRGSMRSVVVDDHVYIKNGDGVEELYHSPSDPGELNNLAADPSASAILEVCRRKLQQILHEDLR